MYLYTILLLFIRTKEIHIQGLKMYMQLLMDNPVQMPFLIALICVVLILPMRVTCTLAVEDYLIVLAICFMSFNFFSFLRYLSQKLPNDHLKSFNFDLTKIKNKKRAFKVVGTFALTFYLIIKRDMSRFFVIYGIYILGLI